MDYLYRPVARSVAIETAKRLVVDAIWKIANIELPKGVTFPQTQAIFDGITPEHTDVETVIVVNNLKRSWLFLFDQIDCPVNMALVSEYNKMIGAGLFERPGELRTNIVGISGTDYIPVLPNRGDIVTSLKAINSLENPIDKGLTVLGKVSRGQWFHNGNKRTAQMVANHVMIQNNAAILAIPVQQREAYLSNLISYYESNDLSSFKDYVYQTATGLLPSGLTLERLIKVEMVQRGYQDNPFNHRLVFSQLQQEVQQQHNHRESDQQINKRPRL
jgi:hypothetical protein